MSGNSTEIRPVTPDKRWHIEVLGGLRATANGVEVRCFASRRVGALLARLAVSPTRSASRDELIDLFWGDMDVDAARHNLRQTLFSLRRALDRPGFPSAVLADHDKVWLDSATIVTDLEEFEGAARIAKQRSGQDAIEALTRAAELYRGELLAGRYEEWIIPERRKLEAAYLAVLHDLQTRLLEDGYPLRAAQYGLCAVAANPYEEAGHLAVMQLYSAAGRSDLVERQLGDMTRLLRDDLEVEPSQECLDQVKRLLEQCRGRARSVEAAASTAASAHQIAARRYRFGIPQVALAAALLLGPLVSGVYYNTSLAASGPSANAEDGFQQLARLRENQAGLVEDAGARDRHAAICLSLAEQAWATWYGRDEERWARRFEGAQDDVRLALRWYLEREPDKAVQLAGAMTRFWYLRDHAREGHRWLSEALDKGPRIHSDSRARALIGAAFLAGDHGSAQDSQCMEALAIYRERGNPWGMAHALRHLGFFASERQAAGAARRYYEEALSLFQRIGDERGQAVTLLCLGFVAPEDDSFVKWAQAKAWVNRSLALFRKVGNSWGVSMATSQQGVIANYEGRPWDAETLFLASLKMNTRTVMTAREAETQGTVELLRGRWTEGQTLAAKALVCARDQGDRATVARLLESYVGTYKVLGQDRWARLLGASAALDRSLGARQERRWVVKRDAGELLMRRSMDAQRYESAYRDGEALSWSDAVDEALMVLPR